MKLQVLGLLFTRIAFGSTIPITGHGQFWLGDPFESNAMVMFGGSNGTDSVSFGGDVPAGGSPPTSFYVSSKFIGSPLRIYIATIDGVTSHVWTLSLSDGGGNLTIFDDAGNVLNTEDLLGTIQITSYWESGPRFFPSGEFNSGWVAQGTFAIVSPDPLGTDPSVVPEAGSGILLGVGLTALIYLKKSEFVSTAFGRIRSGNRR